MRPTKDTIRDLAILGGKPAFSDALHVNRPNIGDKAVFFQHLDQAMERRWLTNHGPLVQDLERQLSDYLDVEHCVTACNGTMALALVIQALALEGEVIIPSFSFISTAHVLTQSRIKPIFCDIDPITWNIDPAECDRLINEKTSAIIGTHLWGRPCDTRYLEEIAQRAGLPLLFDSAHAFGCSHRGKKIAAFGDAEIFSFHATKVFHTFEGGAVTTNDSELAKRLRMIRNFGFSGYDQVDMVGTNAKMSEACAAMGLANLEWIERFIERNRQVGDLYRTELKGIPGLKLLDFDTGDFHNHHYLVLEVSEREVGLTRDQLMRILHAENVIARRYFYPGNHRMEPYRSRFPEVDQRLPHTNQIAQRVLLLPGGTGVTDQQIKETCAILRIAVDNGSVIGSSLG